MPQSKVEGLKCTSHTNLTQSLLCARKKSMCISFKKACVFPSKKHVYFPQKMQFFVCSSYLRASLMNSKFGSGYDEYDAKVVFIETNVVYQHVPI